MATVNFLFRSTKQKAPLTLRLLYRHLNKDYVFASRTNCEVEKEYWKKHYKNTKDAEIKNLQIKINTELQKIENYILDRFKETDIKEVSKEWLTEQIYYYYNPPTENNFSDLVTDVIQQIIEEAPYRENGKGGIGIGQCRVNDYKRLKEMFIEFQKGKKYRTVDLNNNAFKLFREWLLKIKKYSHTYSAKKISDLKGICKYARSKGLEVAVDLESVKAKQVSAYDDDMDVIILTPKEIEKIEKTILTSEALINARKWLILGCYTGQRGKALTTRIRKENFHKILSERTRHFAIALEDIFQPHNANAVIRSADCFGIQDIYTIETINEFEPSRGVSKGAIKWINRTKFEDFDAAFETIKAKGYQIVATSPHTEDCNLEDFDVTKKSVFFFGAEKKGISEKTKEQADVFLKIPMQGFTESFNISVSAALCMYDVSTRLRASNVDWQLSEEEKTEIQIDWCKQVIKNPEGVEKELLRRIEEELS